MRNHAVMQIPAAIQKVYEASDERLRAVAISPAEGLCLQRIFAAQEVRTSLEIGCAYGLSSMFICDTLARKDASCLHTIIDPYQSSVFASRGVNNLEAADLRCFKLLEEPSELALPRLVGSGMRFDAALIDGYHTFDQTILDLYYVTKLLRVGGYLAIDDCNLPAVNRAVRYLLTYPCYQIVDSTPHHSTRRRMLTGTKWAIAILLKPLTWPLGKLSYEFLDGSLIDPRVLRVADTARMLVLRKVSEDERWAWWFEYL
jgi:predicted O-methyltransferase YrrM